MFKKALMLTSILALASCAKFYDRGGKTPEDLKNPTLSEQYVAMGAFFNNEKVEKRGYSQFAKEKCVENGFKGYEGYAISKGYTSGWILFCILPLSDGYKTAKLWCKN